MPATSPLQCDLRGWNVPIPSSVLRGHTARPVYPLSSVVEIVEVTKAQLVRPREAAVVRQPPQCCVLVFDSRPGARSSPAEGERRKGRLGVLPHPIKRPRMLRRQKHNKAADKARM